MLFFCLCASVRTHSGRENDDPQDIHALAGARKRPHYHIRRWRQIQLEVLDVRPVIILNPVDESAPSGGFCQTGSHCRLGGLH